MKTALLVIDFINDLCHPEGKFAASAAMVKENKVITHANQAIEFARNQKIPVILVKVGFSADYAECPENSPIFSRAKSLQALQLNTWGTEFHEELNVAPHDYVVVKNRISAFYATSLEAFLRAQHIQKLIICGVSTDMAVQTTARDAHDRDYSVTIIGDACAATTPELHVNTLNALQRLATIIKSSDL